MPGLSRVAAPAGAELSVRWRHATNDYISALSVSREGQRCVLGLGDGRVLGLDVATGRELFCSAAHAGGVLGVSIAPDGRFVTCGQDSNARVWSSSGALMQELTAADTGWVEHAAWAPAGNRIATAAGRTVRVWSAEGEPLVETDGFASTVTGLAWRADGSGLAAICYGGVHLLPFVPQAKARHLAWKGSLVSLAWSPDGKVIACGSQDASVHFWRLASGEDSMMSGYKFKPKALAWDSESKLLATSGDTTVTVWDFRGKGPEGTRPIRLDAHHGVCTRLAFSPEEGLLASGSQDTSILLWEPRRSRKPQRFAFLEDEVTALAWHPERHTLLGADAGGNIAAWQVNGR